MFMMNLLILCYFRKKLSHRKKTPEELKQQKWNETDMENAIQAFESGEMTIFKAAKTYNVPRTTLRRLVE